MSKIENETQSTVKRLSPRYIVIHENIHEVLDLYTLSLYIAFRFETDYSKEESEVKRSAKFFYKKAKISQAQYYRCLNKLEQCGLVYRDEGNKLGEMCVFHVAQELGYFSQGISGGEGGISGGEGGISGGDTDHYSFPLKDLISINNTYAASAKIDKPKTQKAVNSVKTQNLALKELIDVYRKVFPDNPQPHSSAISTSLGKALLTLVKRWPELDPEGKGLTPEAFERYMLALKSMAPKFALGEYVTEQGNKTKHGLETFCRWNTVVKFLEGAYS